VYIVILCFIGIGAILRNVNLLIVATGMLVTPLIFNWRVCVANLRSLTAQRMTPDRVHAGETVNVLWSCENEQGRVTARNVMLYDQLKNESHSVSLDRWSRFKNLLVRIGDSLFQRRKFSGKFANVIFPGVTVSAPGYASYQCMFPSRGEYELGPAVLQTSFPFGLVSCGIPVNDKESVFVAPRLGNLHPTWEQRIDSMEVGDESRKRRRGLEQDEFFALRKWRAGDNQKHVHWRSTARFGFPLVKQFDQPNDRDFALLLDLHTDDEVTRLQCELALSFAATALAELGSEVQGQLGIAVCGKKNSLIVGRHNPETRRNVMRRLAIAQPTNAPDLQSAAIDLATRVSMGTPLYCFSTRGKPEWLTSEETSADSHPTLPTVRQLVRWIQIDSPQFDELFELKPESTTQKQGTVQQEELSTHYQRSSMEPVA
jgi:uncharacterized protein (DUF58 family)